MRSRSPGPLLVGGITAALCFFQPVGLRADSASKCAQRLEQARQRHRKLDVLNELKQAFRRCTEDVAIHFEAAHLYLELQAVADEDWLQLAFEHFCLAVDADTANPESREHLAHLLVYLGEYELARPHYEWLAELPGFSGASSAREHATTCTFLSGLTGRPEISQPRKMRQILKGLDLSDSARVLRAEWKWLQELNCAVAVAAMRRSVVGAEPQACVSHCLLYDWIKEPFREELDSRAACLTGMLSWLTTTVRQYGLEAEVMSYFTDQRRAPKGSWPEAGFGGSLEALFRDRKPDSLRSCTFSESLEVNHVWRIPDLRGIWHCRVAPAVKEGEDEKPRLEFDVEIKQQADSVFLLLPPVEGEFAKRSRLTLLLDGRKLKTHSWEQFATVRESEHFELTGELRLDETYRRLEGMLLRYYFEIRLSTTFSLSYAWSEGGGQYTLEKR